MKAAKKTAPKKPATDRAAIVAKVCERMETGESLRKSCEAEGAKPSTFMGWVRADPAILEQYMRAREAGADAEFDNLQDLSDEPPEKTMTGGVDSAWVAWQKNRIETRKWVIARKAPKKYGDKMTLAGDAEAPLAAVVSPEMLATMVQMTPEQLRALASKPLKDE